MMLVQRFFFYLVVLLSIGLFSLGCSEEEEGPIKAVTPDKEGPWILVDIYHTTKQNPVDYRLEKGNFSYQGVFGFWRAFEHLSQNGYKWSEHRDVLTAEVLEGYDALFINLVSDDRPDFTDAEVELIQEYVKAGGGLFIIVDHSNVYGHAERVNRFLIPMGIESLYHTATDSYPDHAIAGIGWILVRDFIPHAITRGLEMVCLQTGGAVVTSGNGVGLTSDESFADLWDVDGFGGVGNWTWDGDEEVEPLGPLEVIAGVEFGKGRIAVVGDQNIFGDSWLHFGDNFELLMNSIEWVAQEDETTEHLADIRPFGVNIGMHLPQTDYMIGKSSSEGFFAFYVNANRDLEVTARATLRLDGRDDVMMLMNPVKEFTETELQDLQQYLAPGKRLVLTFEADEINASTLQVLRAVAPNFTLGVGDRVLNLDDIENAFPPTPADPLIFESAAGIHALSSDYLEVSGLSLGSYENLEEGEASLIDVTSQWGDVFLSTDGGIDLARVKTAESGGELIIFLQDGFFRNRSMGGYLTVPDGKRQPLHDLQYLLQDFFKKGI